MPDNEVSAPDGEGSFSFYEDWLGLQQRRVKIERCTGAQFEDD